MPRAAARTHDDEFPSNIIYRKIFSMFNFRNCENFASKFCYVHRSRAFYIEKNRFVFFVVVVAFHSEEYSAHELHSLRGMFCILNK